MFGRTKTAQFFRDNGFYVIPYNSLYKIEKKLDANDRFNGEMSKCDKFLNCLYRSMTGVVKSSSCRSNDFAATVIVTMFIEMLPKDTANNFDRQIMQVTKDHTDPGMVELHSYLESSSIIEVQ